MSDTVEAKIDAAVARGIIASVATVSDFEKAALAYRPRRQTRRAQQVRFDHRTKTEHPATILLPNPVAADDTERHATDRPVKIRRQINTRWGGGSRAAMAITEFRVRCMSEKLLDVTGKGYSKPPIDNA
jgi:hypothetical protein